MGPRKVYGKLSIVVLYVLHMTQNRERVNELQGVPKTKRPGIGVEFNHQLAHSRLLVHKRLF
jgi:hypothetical protein